MKNTNSHFYHQHDLPLQTQILNISVNLGRVGNWVYQLQGLIRTPEVYRARLELIKKVNGQTRSYVNDLYSQKLSEPFKTTLEKCKKDFDKLNSQDLTSVDHSYWAEKALTWANILQHRVKLA